MDRPGIAEIARPLLVSCAVVVFLAGCSKPKESTDRAADGQDKRSVVHTVPAEEKLKLAFVPNAPAAFWNLAQNGLNKFEKETGIKVTLEFPANGTVEDQNRILEDLISQGYHGVCLSVVAPDDQIRELNKASQSMNVITTDSDSPNSQRLAFVGPRQYDAGQAAGQEIVALLPQGGKIALFVGDMTAENARERIRGINAVIEGRSIEIVATKEDSKDLTKARAQVEDVINSIPDVNVLVGLWSYNGPAIRDALTASGKATQIKAVTFDEEDGTLQGIEEGVITSTIVLTPFDYGYQSAKLLCDLARQGEAALPNGGWINTGFKVINRQSLPEFRQQLVEWRRW